MWLCSVTKIFFLIIFIIWNSERKHFFLDFYQFSLNKSLLQRSTLFGVGGCVVKNIKICSFSSLYKKLCVICFFIILYNKPKMMKSDHFLWKIKKNLRFPFENALFFIRYRKTTLCGVRGRVMVFFVSTSVWTCIFMQSIRYLPEL